MTEKRLENLDLNLLLALHWLLSEQNVTAAADRLGLSQPAASRALSRLRETFDDPLLVKSGNRMALTRFAETLQAPLAHAIERCRDVLRVTAEFDPAEQEGAFRIACVDFVGAIAARAWANGIAALAPKLDLEIVSLSIEASRELISGKIDLAIVPDPALMNVPGSVDLEQFVRKRIIGQEYFTAVRREHPVANGKMTTKQFIAYDHILVTPSGSRIGIVDRALDELGMKRRIAYRTASFMVALPIVLSTDCILTAPHGLLHMIADKLSLSPPPIPINGYSLYGGWHPNWTHDERHKWVRNRLFSAMIEQEATISS